MTSRQFRALVLVAAIGLLAGCGGENGRIGANSGGVVPSSAGPSQAGRLLGDMDDDGSPSVGDAIAILRIVVGLAPDDRCADTNGNGVTDVGDAINVLRCVVGLDQWPIGHCGGEPGFYSAYVEGASWLYHETWPDQTVHEIVFTVLGTRDIGGVECIDIRVDEEGAPLLRVFGTLSESEGGFIYAQTPPNGVIGGPLDAPSQWLPGDPPDDFTTTTELWPLNGTYDGRVVSTAASVDTPAGTYENAAQVDLIRRQAARLGADRMTIWLVRGIGIVRIELDFGTDGIFDISLVSFTPAS